MLSDFSAASLMKSKGQYCGEGMPSGSKFRGVISIYPKPPSVENFRACFQKWLLLSLFLFVCAQSDLPVAWPLMPPTPAKVHGIYIFSYEHVKVKMLQEQ